MSTIDFNKNRVDQQQQYSDDSADSQYVMDEGLLVLPVQGPRETPPVVVRVHAPYSRRTSRFSYTKKRVPPLIPSPADTKSGYYFLGGTLILQAPNPSAAGELVYSVGGVYDYVSPLHVRDEGKLLWDAKPYLSGVDMLGNIPENMGEQTQSGYGGYYNTYTGIYFDLAKFTSARILG